MFSAAAISKMHLTRLATGRSGTTAAALLQQCSRPAAVASYPTTETAADSCSLARRHYVATTWLARKPGVSPPIELKAFVEAAKEKLVVVDVREASEGTEEGPLPNAANGVRPQAINLSWDRAAASMPLPDAAQVPSTDTPIITHCGGGGRGQKARDFLEKNGYTNVVNGGGPEDAECWNEFGDK